MEKRIKIIIRRISVCAIFTAMIFSMVNFYFEKTDFSSNNQDSFSLVDFIKISSCQAQTEEWKSPADRDGTDPSNNVQYQKDQAAKNTASNEWSFGGFLSQGAGWAVSFVLGAIAYVITAVIGFMITVLVKILMQIAQYNGFISASPVMIGWTIIRDICNMFFIMILLVIAFATILRQENYSIKKMLPKLLIMAVLINFSKTIFGLIIDSGQVVMLTFANAIVQGGGWFIEVFRVKTWFKTNENYSTFSTEAGVDQWGVVLAMIAGIIAAIISLIVIAVILGVLVVRIVMIWIYVIFSPLVFLGFAFSPIQKYTGQIWQDFIKQVIVGPVLLFFVWLALLTASSDPATMGITSPLDKNSKDGKTVCVGAGAFFCSDELQKFIIMIGLLMGGLMAAQNMGGAAAGFAGSGLNWAKKIAGAPGSLASSLALGSPGWVASKIKMGAVSDIFGIRGEKIETDKAGNVIGTRTSYRGKKYTGIVGAKIANALYGLETNPVNIYKGIKEGLASKTEKDKMRGVVASSDALKGGGALGLIKGLGASRDLTEALAHGFFWFDGMKRAVAVARGKDKNRMILDSELKQAYAAQKALGDVYSDSEIDKQKELIGESEGRYEGSKAGGAPEEELKKLRKTVEEQKDLLKKMELNRDEKKDEKMEKIGNKISQLRDKMTYLRPIQTFYADRERDALISQTQQKLGNTNNEDMLKELFNNAIANKDREAAAAIMLHAARVGHLNEMIHSQRAQENVTEKYIDENGDKKERILIRTGEKFHQSGYGLSAMVNQILVKKLGMSDQQAYAVQADASMLAKSVGHFNMAETITSVNGRLKQLSEEEHLARASGERRKVPPRRYFSDFNRIAHGTEIEPEEGARTFKINDLGFKNFLENAGTYKNLLYRNEFNKNAAMNIATDAGRLREFVIKLKDAGIEDFYDELTQKQVKYSEVAESLIKYGENLSRVSTSAGEKMQQANKVIEDMRETGAQSNN